MEPGQDLVLAGFAGLTGSLILLKEKRKELSKTFSASFIKEAETMEGELRKRPEHGPISWPDGMALESLGEGGIFASLWSLADDCHRGIEVWLSDIPVRQETIEICEVFDVNPYELYSGGSFLLAAWGGNSLVRKLKREGIAASVIGSVRKGRDRVIYTREGKRFVTRPQPDGLYKINWEESR